MINAVFPVLCTDDLEASRDFYCELLGLEVMFESGWYTALATPGNKVRQIVAFVLPDHPSVPAPYGISAAGVLATFEVDDVDAVHESAVSMGLEPVLSLRNEDFGQRHFMVSDPAGVLVDVVTPIRPARSFLREVAEWRRAHR